MKKYLSYDGLQNYDTNIKGYINENIPVNVSELENDAGYLTEHQDLSNYATKEYLQQYVEESILGGEW